MANERQFNNEIFAGILRSLYRRTAGWQICRVSSEQWRDQIAVAEQHTMSLLQPIPLVQMFTGKSHVRIPSQSSGQSVCFSRAHNKIPIVRTHSGWDGLLEDVLNSSWRAENKRVRNQEKRIWNGNWREWYTALWYWKLRFWMIVCVDHDVNW